jgi:hypothetical protein
MRKRAYLSQMKRITLILIEAILSFQPPSSFMPPNEYVFIDSKL